MIDYFAILFKSIPQSKRLCCSLWPSVAITLGLASNRRPKPVLITQLNAGFEGLERSLTIYCRLSCWRRKQRGSSPASTCRLGIGEVRNAKRQVRSTAFWTRSRL